MAIVVTTCSNRKRCPPDLQLCARDLKPGTLNEVATAWISRLTSAKPVARASELYCGRNFSEADKAARTLRAPLFVLSAGLGLIHADDSIPSYGLTVSSRSPDSVLGKITTASFSVDWWNWGASQSPFARDLSSTLADLGRSGGPVLIALSHNYLRMVQNALLPLSDSHIPFVRIFSAASLDGIDARIGRLVMPYDERLDGSDSSINTTSIPE
jgi:hypothetical protein